MMADSLTRILHSKFNEALHNKVKIKKTLKAGRMIGRIMNVFFRKKGPAFVDRIRSTLR